MKVFLQALIGQILLNAYIFRRGYRALPPQKGWRRPFVVCFIAELSLYFTGFFFYQDLPDGILIPIMQICNTWYIASIYVVMGLIGIDLLRWIHRLRPWYPRFIRRHPQTTQRTLFFLFLAGITGLMINGWHNAVYPVVRQVSVHIPKVVEGRDSLTIALMSDTHFGEFVGKKQAQRFVSLCNAQHPDLVVIVGDLIDYESRFAERAHIEEDLRRLTAPLGVYITLGNHEYRANRFAKFRWIEKTGGLLLVDSVVTPEPTFYLVGRDDAINRRRASLQTLLKNTDPAKPIIVIDHQPRAFNESLMNKADLVLQGHTHNGQLWPHTLLLKFVYEWVFGYYRKGDTQFYISSGIGYAGPPYRVGTRSELVLLHLTFDRSK